MSHPGNWIKLANTIGTSYGLSLVKDDKKVGERFALNVIVHPTENNNKARV